MENRLNKSTVVKTNEIIILSVFKRLSNQITPFVQNSINFTLCFLDYIKSPVLMCWGIHFT